MQNPKLSESDRRESLRAIEENPGLDRVFTHCVEQWTTDKECPPAIFCPNCCETMIDSNATIEELLAWQQVLKEQLDETKESDTN